ncbi:hypothetical protein ABPG72_002480 [Tetrahymena utriculariae]
MKILLERNNLDQYKQINQIQLSKTLQLLTQSQEKFFKKPLFQFQIDTEKQNIQNSQMNKKSKLNLDQIDKIFKYSDKKQFTSKIQDMLFKFRQFQILFKLLLAQKTSNYKIQLKQIQKDIENLFIYLNLSSQNQKKNKQKFQNAQPQVRNAC